MVNKFIDLEIWQLARMLSVKVYQLLKDFPSDEKFGIVSQCKSSVISVPANIAEGFGRYHFADKIKFYYNARGSLLETKSHLLVSESLGFIKQSNTKLLDEIKSEIEVLSVKLNNFISRSRPAPVSQ